MQHDVGRHAVVTRALEPPVAQARGDAFVDVCRRARPDPRASRIGIDYEHAKPVGSRLLDERSRNLEELHPAPNVPFGRGGEQAVRK